MGDVPGCGADSGRGSMMRQAQIDALGVARSVPVQSVRTPWSMRSAALFAGIGMVCAAGMSAFVCIVRTGAVRGGVQPDDRLRFDQLWLPANAIVAMATVAVCLIAGIALIRGSASRQVVTVAVVAGLIFVGAVGLVVGVSDARDLIFAAGSWPRPSLLLWTYISAVAGFGAIIIGTQSLSDNRRGVRNLLAAACAVTLVAGGATLIAWPDDKPDVSPVIVTADMHDVRLGLPDSVTTRPANLENPTWLWPIAAVGPGFVSLGRRDGTPGHNTDYRFAVGAHEWAESSYSIRFTNGDDLTPRWWMRLPSHGWLSRVVVVPAHTVIVATVTTEEGSLTYGIDPTAGRIRWSRPGELIGDLRTLSTRTPGPLPPPTSEMTTASSLVDIEPLGRAVTAWSPDTGADLWQHDVGPDCSAHSIEDERTWINVGVSCPGGVKTDRALDTRDGRYIGEWSMFDNRREPGRNCAPYMCVARIPQDQATGDVQFSWYDFPNDLVDMRTGRTVLSVSAGEFVACNDGGDCIVSDRENNVRVARAGGTSVRVRGIAGVHGRPSTGTVVSLRDQIVWRTGGSEVVVMHRATGTATMFAAHDTASDSGTLVQAGYLFITDSGRAVILPRGR